MGPVFSACAGLFGFLDEDEFDFAEEGADEKLAVEELLQDAAGVGFPVEITIDCSELPDKDKFSKSDPFVVVQSVEDDGTVNPVGRTETIQNNLNPQFVTAVIDSYSPKDDHILRFIVYHLSNPGEKEDRQQKLGTLDISLAILMKRETSSHVLVAPAAESRHEKRQQAGYINLSVQQIGNVQEEVCLTLSAKGLSRFSRSAPHPFLTVFRVQKKKLIPVAKTNIARNTTHPTWREIRVKSFRLCSNDYDLPLQLQVHSGDPSGNHRYIGSAKTTLATILSGSIRQLPVINEKSIGNKGYVNSGEVIIEEVKRSAPNSFLDYVKAGAEINCTIAIDCSASNFGTSNHNSLHHISENNPEDSENDYIKALRAVCKVVGRYDKDQMFPLYGFGAIPPGVEDKEAHSHCFPMSLDWENIEVQGEEALVRTYVRAIMAVRPREPTRMAPVIHEVVQGTLDDDDGGDGLQMPGGAKEPAHDEVEGRREMLPPYQLLVILTDGEIMDLTETIDAAVEASARPMSILIVGMGDPHLQKAGFKLMAQLDGEEDGGPLRSVISGKSMKRDIVNFIVYDEYKHATANDFARGALAEIPGHFLSWVEMTGYSMRNLNLMQNKRDGDSEDDVDVHVLSPRVYSDGTATIVGTPTSQNAPLNFRSVLEKGGTDNTVLEAAKKAAALPEAAVKKTVSQDRDLLVSVNDDPNDLTSDAGREGRSGNHRGGRQSYTASSDAGLSDLQLPALPTIVNAYSSDDKTGAGAGIPKDARDAIVQALGANDLTEPLLSAPPAPIGGAGSAGHSSAGREGGGGGGGGGGGAVSGAGQSPYLGNVPLDAVAGEAGRRGGGGDRTRVNPYGPALTQTRRKHGAPLDEPPPSRGYPSRGVAGSARAALGRRGGGGGGGIGSDSVSYGVKPRASTTTHLTSASLEI